MSTFKKILNKIIFIKTANESCSEIDENDIYINENDSENENENDNFSKF